MRVLTPERFTFWTHETGLVALAVLACVAFVPGGLLWAAALAMGLLGSAAVTAVLVHRRSIPSPAQIIGIAEAEPVAALVSRGDRGATRACAGGERNP